MSLTGNEDQNMMQALELEAIMSGNKQANKGLRNQAFVKVNLISPIFLSIQEIELNLWYNHQPVGSVDTSTDYRAGARADQRSGSLTPQCPRGSPLTSKIVWR